MKRSISLLLICLLVAGPAIPASKKPEAKTSFDLTIDSIMRGPGLYGYEPRAVRWSADSQRIYFQWKQASDPREKEWDTWVVNRDNTGLRKLSEEEARNAPPVMADQTKDKKQSAYVEGGDLVLYDNVAGARRQLTRTTDLESGPRFTRDGKHITFLRSNNLYRMSLESGSIEQFTDIRAAGATTPSAPPATGFGMGFFGQFFGRQVGQTTTATGEQQRGTDSQEFLKKEERELLEVVKRRAARREEDEARRKKQNPRKPFTLQGRQTVAGLQLAPDQKHVVAMVGEPGEGAKSTIVPNYVTESGYTEDIPARGKVGDSQGRTRMAILSVETGEVKWVEHGLKPPAEPGAAKTEPAAAKTEPGVAKAEPAAAKTEPATAGPEQAERPRRPLPQREREVTLYPPIWSEDGARAVMMVRAADSKDRWIMALDPVAAKTRILFTDHDDTWMGGPGMSTLGWMKDDRTIYFQSERDGYSHLYTVSYDGGEPRQLTSGRWEVQGVRLSEDKARFYITANEGSPFERHLSVMPVEGGARTRITSLAGSHQAVPSPDEKWLAVIHSFSNKPPELYIQENRPGAEAVKVTSSPLPEFWNYPWIDPPIVQIPARDGALVPARIYRPNNYKPGGPGVIFVHGAGYQQNVHRWWSGNAQVYLFHHLLMEHGYLVLDLDYRASAGYGRDWRTAVYRHMGGKDLDDQVDAARWMAKEQGVDPKRIGIYGGSYGGFLTLMAMFTQPEVFAAGAALRPVTHWAHYAHPYTSNILNLPQKDAEAYRRSSPIYHAQGLKGALLICHGVVDTNVHFQDTVRLVQRLIELRKENWELAIYPAEDHGFVEATSWADEYKRIFKLFENNLKKPAAAAEPRKAAGKGRKA